MTFAVDVLIVHLEAFRTIQAKIGSHLALTGKTCISTTAQ